MGIRGHFFMRQRNGFAGIFDESTRGLDETLKRFAEWSARDACCIGNGVAQGGVGNGRDDPRRCPRCRRVHFDGLQGSRVARDGRRTNQHSRPGHRPRDGLPAQPCRKEPHPRAYRQYRARCARPREPVLRFHLQGRTVEGVRVRILAVHRGHGRRSHGRGRDCAQPRQAGRRRHPLLRAGNGRRD